MHSSSMGVYMIPIVISGYTISPFYPYHRILFIYFFSHRLSSPCFPHTLLLFL